MRNRPKGAAPFSDRIRDDGRVRTSDDEAFVRVLRERVVHLREPFGPEKPFEIHARERRRVEPAIEPVEAVIVTPRVRADLEAAAGFTAAVQRDEDGQGARGRRGEDQRALLVLRKGEVFPARIGDRRGRGLLAASREGEGREGEEVVTSGVHGWVAAWSGRVIVPVAPVVTSPRRLSTLPGPVHPPPETSFDPLQTTSAPPLRAYRPCSKTLGSHLQQVAILLEDSPLSPPAGRDPPRRPSAPSSGGS